MKKITLIFEVMLKFFNNIKAKAILCIVYASIAFTLNAQYTWTQKASMSNTRYDAAGFTIGTKLYLATGGTGTTMNELWEWDQNTNVWTQKANFPGTGRFDAIGFAIGSKGYVGLGASGSTDFNDFYEYDPVSNTWTAKANFPGTARRLPGAFVINGKGYVGTGNNSSSGNFTDFYEYDPVANTWTAKANFPGAARWQATSFSIGTKGYIGMGLGTSTPFYQDFYEWNSANNTWTKIANFPANGRGITAAFTLGSYGYVCTGYDFSTYYKDVHRYDPSTNTWTALANFAGSARWEAVGLNIGNRGYIATGYDASSALGDLWEYKSACTYSITTSQTNVTCAGANTGSASVSVTGTTSPYTFSWNTTPVQTTSSISNLSAGAYRVTITDNTSCSIDTTITITAPSPINVTATATPPTVSIGGTTQLNASTLSGIFNENFDPINTSQWNSTGDGVTSTSCGSYSGNALYFDGYTREAITNNINTTSGGTISFYLKIAYGTSSPCEAADAGEDVLFQYSTNGGSSWTTMQTFFAGSSTYQNFSKVTITIPAGAYSPATQFRWGQVSNSGMGYDNWAIDNISIISGSIGTYTYKWLPTKGLSSSTIANPIATIDSNIIYYVTLTDTKTGCTGSGQVSVFVLKTSTSPATNVKQNSATLNGMAFPDNLSTTVSFEYGLTTSYGSTITGVPSPVTGTSLVAVSANVTGLLSGGYTYHFRVKTVNSKGTVYGNDLTFITLDCLTVNPTATPSVVCPGGTTQLNAAVSGGVLNENFDPINSSQWLSTGDGVASTDCGSYSGSALYFDGYTREAITKDINLPSGGTIDFYLKIAYGTSSPCEAADAGEDVLLQYSVNGGSSWTTIQTFLAGGSTYQNFTKVSLTIPAGAYSSATRFCWIQITNSGSGFDNWALDDISISGIGGTFTYAWLPAKGLSSTSIANPIATIDSNITYRVTVTDTKTGCKGSGQVNITTGSLTVDAGYNKNIICGDSVLLNVTTNMPGDKYTYLWTPSAGLSSTTIANPYASPGKSTTYVVTVHSATGICSAVDSVRINVSSPTADAGYDKNIICGNSVQLNVTTDMGGYLTYQWSPSNSLSSATVANPYANPGKTTTYIVTVRNKKSNCVAVDSVHVFVSSPTVDAGYDKNITCGNSVQLNATTNMGGSITYLWTPSAGLSSTTVANPYANPKKTTTYYVTVHNLIGNCTGVDSVHVIVNKPNYNVNFTGTPQMYTKPPFAVQFTNSTPAISNYTFIWYFGDGSFQNSSNLTVFHTYLYNGLYTVKLVAISNTSGCEDTFARIDYIYCIGGLTAPPVANFTGIPESIPVGGTVNFSDNSVNIPTSWSWSFPGGNPATSTQQNPLNIKYNKKGLYNVTLIVKNGGGADTLTKYNYINVGNVGIGETNIADLIKIYPNPASEKLTIEFKDIVQDAEVSLYNMEGQLMLQQKLSGKQNDIDLRMLVNGLYFVKVFSMDGVGVWKIMKE